MADDAQTACTVDGRRFIQFRADTGDRRQIDDRLPADFLPDTGDDDDTAEVVRLDDKVLRFAANCGDDPRRCFRQYVVTTKRSGL